MRPSRVTPRDIGRIPRVGPPRDQSRNGRVDKWRLNYGIKSGWCLLDGSVKWFIGTFKAERPPVFSMFYVVCPNHQQNREKGSISKPPMEYVLISPTNSIIQESNEKWGGTEDCSTQGIQHIFGLSCTERTGLVYSKVVGAERPPYIGGSVP